MQLPIRTPSVVTDTRDSIFMGVTVNAESEGMNLSSERSRYSGNLRFYLVYTAV
jgi:hypothetical protein